MHPRPHTAHGGRAADDRVARLAELLRQAQAECYADPADNPQKNAVFMRLADYLDVAIQAVEGIRDEPPKPPRTLH